MTRTTNEPVVQPDLAAEAAAPGKTRRPPPAPGKTRRPRRMAREPGAAPQPASSDANDAKPTTTKQITPRSDSKIARVIAVLSREEGAITHHDRQAEAKVGDAGC